MTDPRHSSRDADLRLFQVLREDGSADPSLDPLLSDEMLKGLHRGMLFIRLLDERMLMRQRQGRVGFYGTITGQEATPIATAFATEKRDWIFPALREGAIMLMRGFPLHTWLAQVYGNSGDLLKGRQMPSHMSGREVNQVAWSSVIGPQIPQAVGAAMAAANRGDDVVTIGFMGDGATSEPAFHTAMQFAAKFKAPTVLICQNNHWSISVPTEKQTAAKTIAVKARAYGMPGIRVDGNDILATYLTIKDAVARARGGDGPTFIEAVTYRMGPHSSSDDPTRYRAQEEVDAWAKKDPITRLEAYLMRAQILDEAALTKLREDITAEILLALKQVEALSPPERETLFTDVYERSTDRLLRQKQQLLDTPPAPQH